MGCDVEYRQLPEPAHRCPSLKRVNVGYRFSRPAAGSQRC